MTSGIFYMPLVFNLFVKLNRECQASFKSLGKGEAK